MANRLVTACPFSPAVRLAGRVGAGFAALAALVDGDPDDLTSMLEVMGLTDAIVRDAAGALQLLPAQQRYRGRGAAAVMLPFLSPHPSRFSAGRFGVLYGANDDPTAIAEVSYHHERRLRASSAPSGTSILLSRWTFAVHDELADLRSTAGISHPSDYAQARAAGERLRNAGAAGVMYRSARARGECLGVFVPRAVRAMQKHDAWRLIWNGTMFSEVLRVA